MFTANDYQRLPMSPNLFCGPHGVCRADGPRVGRGLTLRDPPQGCGRAAPRARRCRAGVIRAEPLGARPAMCLCQNTALRRPEATRTGWAQTASSIQQRPAQHPQRPWPRTQSSWLVTSAPGTTGLGTQTAVHAAGPWKGHRPLGSALRSHVQAAEFPLSSGGKEADLNMKRPRTKAGPQPAGLSGVLVALCAPHNDWALGTATGMAKPGGSGGLLPVCAQPRADDKRPDCSLLKMATGLQFSVHFACWQTNVCVYGKGINRQSEQAQKTNALATCQSQCRGRKYLSISGSVSLNSTD